jgi:hypothetical protein
VQAIRRGDGRRECHLGRQDQRHEIVLEEDQLTLTSEPIVFNGQMRALRAVWRREERD